MRKRVNFKFDHGDVEGMYTFPLENSGPLVIITNGHNGFYGYGMFPYIQDSLAGRGIASYSYNFSHGGIRDDEDYFTDLERYRQNCMRLEKLDLLAILRGLGGSEIRTPERGPFLLSHSLGSVPVIFAAQEALRLGLMVQGLILMAPIKTLNVFPSSMMEEWEREGVYFMKNNRTGQQLPQGPEFLAEIKASDTSWDVERALKNVESRFLFVHGAEDKDVPVGHSQALKEWADQAGRDATLEVVPNAGHTFNTSHPFTCRTPEIDAAVEAIAAWVRES